MISKVFGLFFLYVSSANALSYVPKTVIVDVDFTNADVIVIGTATLAVSVAIYAYKSVRKVL